MLTGGTLRHSKYIVLITLLGFAVTGCNEFEASQALRNADASGELNAPAPGGGEVDMKALNAELDVLDLSLLDVENEIAKIDLPYLIGQGAGTGAQESLSKNLRGIFNKVHAAVLAVEGRVGDLRTQINERIAKLDPANPLHFVVIMKLREALTYLDDLEAKISSSMDILVGKLNDMLKNVGDKVAQMDPKKPASWVVAYLWEQIKAEVVEFRDKLDAI
jgi:hypothetical protein